MSGMAIAAGASMLGGALGGGSSGPPGYIKKTLFTPYQGAGDSFFKPKTGTLQIDPRFEGLRNQYLGGVQGLQGSVGALSGFGGRFNQLGQEFAGNQGALIQARMNPLRAQIARQEGALKQSLGRRDILGSSFGNQALTSFGVEAGRALGDAQALATAEAGQFRAGLLGQELTAEQASIQNDAILNQLLGEASGEFLQQELQSIGLGANITAALLGQNVSAEATAQQAKANKLNATMQLAGGLAGGIGSLMTTGVTSGIPATYAGSAISTNPAVWGG